MVTPSGYLNQGKTTPFPEDEVLKSLMMHGALLNPRESKWAEWVHLQFFFRHIFKKYWALMERKNLVQIHMSECNSFSLLLSCHHLGNISVLLLCTFVYVCTYCFFFSKLAVEYPSVYVRIGNVSQRGVLLAWGTGRFFTGWNCSAYLRVFHTHAPPNKCWYHPFPTWVIVITKNIPTCFQMHPGGGEWQHSTQMFESWPSSLTPLLSFLVPKRI